METVILSQPFDSEGARSRIGDIVLERLSSRDPTFLKTWIVSAFANRRAVSRIVPELVSLIELGGQVSVVLGIDHRGTSQEALMLLVDSEIPSMLVHNPRPGHTFHPKVYVFEAPGKRAEIVIGSSNLTDGGMYTNYEASVLMTFDLNNTDDLGAYGTVIASLGRFLDPPSPPGQVLTRELVDALADRGDVISEARRELEKALNGKAQDDEEDGDQQDVPASPFEAELIEPAPPSPPADAIPEAAPEVKDGDIELGDLLWEKSNLPASDVQRQEGNPTGGLRLTQAGWEINGQRIDHTRYFRYDVFGNLSWTVGIHLPKQQEASLIPFRVILLGRDYGNRDLVVSHKPSGEAGQRNYTTMFHWGELGGTIRNLNLVGKTFRLYGPPEGQSRFIVEVS